MGRKGSAGAVAFSNENAFPIDTTFYVQLKNDEALLKYIYYALEKLPLKTLNIQAGVPGLNRNDAYELFVPLPPIAVQQEIVDELEGYQKIIAGCRQVVENYKPTIDIDPSWEMVEIGSLVDFSQLGLVKSLKEQSETRQQENPYPYFKMNNITYKGDVDFQKIVFVNATKDELAKFELCSGDFLFNTRNSPELVGKCCVVQKLKPHLLFNNNILRLRFNDNVCSEFVALILNTDFFKRELLRFVSATTSVAAIYQKKLFSIEIPLPSLEIQSEIVGQIRLEKDLVVSSKKLIEIYTQRIQDRISKVWGERF